MFLLYADESGSPGGSDQDHFILAGITVFERKAHWLSLELDKIAAQFHPADPGALELHGSPMLVGKNFWRKVSKPAGRFSCIRPFPAFRKGRLTVLQHH